MTYCDVIVLAAGRGSRAGVDKMLHRLLWDTVIERAVQAFASLDFVKKIIVAASADNIAEIENIFVDFRQKPVKVILGGATRHLSVKAALDKVQSPIVLVHDGARPFVSPPLIESVYKETLAKGSAVPVLAVADSIRKIEQDKIVGIVDRNNYVLVQTPQGYNANELKKAFSLADRIDYSDEAELYLQKIASPQIVEGSADNYKLTSPFDLVASGQKVGVGWDLHKLIKDKPLTICGVKVPYDWGLDAHSDGDVAVHAIIDALLSATGLADIGWHFPDTNPSLKDVSSMLLLAEIAQKLDTLGNSINNLVVLIIADKPKLNSFAEKMKDELSAVLGIKKEQIALHFKTSEGVYPPLTMQCWALCSLS